MIFPDSNILIDIIEKDSIWYDWSFARMADASGSGRVVINHVVVAEVAPFSGELVTFLEAINRMGVEIEALSNQAAYAAGHAFREHR